MPRIRLVAGVLSAAAVLALAQGCSSDAADSGPSPATSSGTASLPSVAASSPVPVSSSPAVAVSSSPRPTPSVVDPSSLTSANPWPADLTPEQVVDAQAAVEAYRGYWRMVDLAIADPGRDWSQQVAQHATGPAEADLVQALRDLSSQGQRAVGTTVVVPQVSKIDGGGIVITDCVDKTTTDILDAAGKSIKAPDEPGSYFRHPSTAQLAQLQDGRWVVALQTDDWAKTC